MYIYNLSLRFESLVVQYPDRTALWFSKNSTLSYLELNVLANRLGRLLIAKGITSCDIIALGDAKTPMTFAAIIACLKLGLPYVFLDSENPQKRLEKILSTCRPKLLLGEKNIPGGLITACGDHEISIVYTDSSKTRSELAFFDPANLPQSREVTGDNIAYIMYTSGSSGFPKGALITHANILNFIEWNRETNGIEPDDILTNVNPLYFDNSVFDVYASLFNGACLVPFTREETYNPDKLVAKIEEIGCTIWFSVPSLLILLQMMGMMDGRHLPSIRRFIFGGEGYPKSKLKPIYDLYKNRADFINVYGPTECTCICSYYPISDQDFETINHLPALGHIAPNFTYKIVDDKGHPVNPGETGELCLMGPQVGKGYYNNPECTTDNFVLNRFNTMYQQIMYKTGDLVRFNPDNGNLYIHGRKDNQIKHLGYRIELEEIETALTSLDYITEAMVLHTQGTSRLVAFVSTSKAIHEESIRQDLRQILPPYMIPSVFRREPILPKNQNGKLDRRSLAEKYHLDDTGILSEKINRRS